MSRQCMSIKVIGSRSYEKTYNFTYFNMLILCIWLQAINEVNFKHNREGHIKVKVKISTSFPILCQILLISTHYPSVCGYRVINKVKFIHEGDGHIKVKVKYLHPFKFYVAHTFCKRVVCVRLNAFLFRLYHDHIKIMSDYIRSLSSITDLRCCFQNRRYRRH